MPIESRFQPVVIDSMLLGEQRDHFETAKPVRAISVRHQRQQLPDPESVFSGWNACSRRRRAIVTGVAASAMRRLRRAYRSSSRQLRDGFGTRQRPPWRRRSGSILWRHGSTSFHGASAAENYRTSATARPPFHPCGDR